MAKQTVDIALFLVVRTECRSDLLVFFRFLFYVADLLCHRLERVLVVGVLHLQLCDRLE